MSDLDVYLDTLFDGLDGYIYSPVKTTDRWESNWFDWPSESSLVSEHILGGSGMFIFRLLFIRRNGRLRIRSANFKLSGWSSTGMTRSTFGMFLFRT